jgi:ABC-type transport system substrate-binding protein
MPGGKPAPNLAHRGIKGYRVAGAETGLLVHNMEHPLIGGYTPEKVALRRAMVLGNNVPREIQIARHGQAIPAMSMMPPLTLGYRADLRTEMGEYSPARAKALLDLYGYLDRNGDGWRELPDGSPLLLELATQSDQTSRALDELWKKDMDALGLRVALKIAQWPENLKSVRGGNFMVWRVTSSAAGPDGKDALERAYGGSIGKGNLARFKMEAFDRIYDRLGPMPDGPARQAVFDEATRILVAYVPYRFNVHRILTDMAYPSLIGYRRPPFSLDWWQYVDIDPEAQKRMKK